MINPAQADGPKENPGMARGQRAPFPGRSPQNGRRRHPVERAGGARNGKAQSEPRANGYGDHGSTATGGVVAPGRGRSGSVRFPRAGCRGHGAAFICAAALPLRERPARTIRVSGVDERVVSDLGEFVKSYG